MNKNAVVVVSMCFFCLISQGVLANSIKDKSEKFYNKSKELKRFGNKKEAIVFAKKSIEVFDKKSAENIFLVKILYNLADQYYDIGNFLGAERIFKRAIEVRKKIKSNDRPNIGDLYHDLAQTYHRQERFSVAEVYYKKAIKFRENLLGSNDTSVGHSLNGLASLYSFLRRFNDAEPLIERSLLIAKSSLDKKIDLAARLHSSANFYHLQQKLEKAKLLYEDALRLSREVNGGQNYLVSVILSDLASVYIYRGRLKKAESLMKLSLSIAEKIHGIDHPETIQLLNNLAVVYYQQQDWRRASLRWHQASKRLSRRILKIRFSQQLSGEQKSESLKRNWYFWAHVKAAFRDSEKKNISEAFLSAQWAINSKVADSLAFMSARNSLDSNLTHLIRQKQDEVRRWQQLEKIMISLFRDNKRSVQIESQMKLIGDNIAKLDKIVSDRFPNYAALAYPMPITIKDVQELLKENEALALILDTGMPEETFVWVVTKNKVKWVRKRIGGNTLKNHVFALRCGLDSGFWLETEKRNHCNKVVGGVNKNKLPFDSNRAYMLYRTLFGEFDKLIKNKHILIVPSGSLSSLPFHILITKKLSKNQLYLTKKSGSLGVQGRNSSSKKGAEIVNLLPNRSAIKAGVLVGDVVVAVNSVPVLNFKDLAVKIGSYPPNSNIVLTLRRGERLLKVTAKLDERLVSSQIKPYIPTLHEYKNLSWLGKKNAITILPSVSSLKSLRSHVKPSKATSQYMAFANPLVGGVKGNFSAAGQKQSCVRPNVQAKKTENKSIFSSFLLRTNSRGGQADIKELRKIEPLPDTADEVCAVAHSKGVDPEKSVYLGAKATETRVKNLLGAAHVKPSIIHFATHAFVAGELADMVKNGNEPALLLTPPDKATKEDDGLLTASEVMTLKLDTDWVVLSACNTAAAGKIGGDALTGLARAFFYAGTRALLVSHWVVDSEKTTKLITSTFDAIKKDPNIGRAEALRRAMSKMIASGGDNAHPSNWAPFVVVGEGGPLQAANR